METKIILGNGLVKKNNIVDKTIERRVTELCNSLERGGEKKTDSAIALDKKPF